MTGMVLIFTGIAIILAAIWVCAIVVQWAEKARMFWLQIPSILSAVLIAVVGCGFFFAGLSRMGKPADIARLELEQK